MAPGLAFLRRCEPDQVRRDSLSPAAAWRRTPLASFSNVLTAWVRIKRGAVGHCSLWSRKGGFLPIFPRRCFCVCAFGSVGIGSTMQKPSQACPHSFPFALLRPSAFDSPPHAGPYRSATANRQIMVENAHPFNRRAEFPTTSRLLDAMARAAASGLSQPRMASGMAMAL